MKRTLAVTLFTLSTSLITVPASAGTPENFNPRSGISLNHLKARLQDQCWVFRDFEINDASWRALNNNDGAAVSVASDAGLFSSQLSTPFLKVDGALEIGFDYTFNSSLKADDTRNLTLALTDHAGVVIRELDHVNFKGIEKGKTFQYNKKFDGLANGHYKIAIAYNGTGGDTKIAIDNLNINAGNAFENGCKASPTASSDVFIAKSNEDFVGNLLTNDVFNPADKIVTYTVTDCKDGQATIDESGNLFFRPNNDFKGGITSLSYKICDMTDVPLCSQEARVTLRFPDGIASVNEEILSQSLSEFRGFYKEEGRIEINWVTNFEQNTDRFEVERSTDGSHFVTAGKLKAHGTSGSPKSYSFMDKVGKNTAHKNDLYYRLKQVNADNKTSFSKILVVRVFNKRALRMVSVTPNPVHNDISVNVLLNENAYVVMKIMNSDGVEMMRRSQRVSEGQNSFQMAGSSKLSPGMYYLEVTVNSKDRMVAKLMKQ